MSYNFHKNMKNKGKSLFIFTSERETLNTYNMLMKLIKTITHAACYIKMIRKFFLTVRNFL